MLLLLVVLLLFTLTQSASLCNGGGQGANLYRAVYNFDDLAIYGPSFVLDGPYTFVVFTRINTAYTSWPNGLVSAMNTNTTFYTEEWRNIASSAPEIISTCQEDITFNLFNNSDLGLYTLKMRAVNVNGTQMVLNATRDGVLKQTQQVTLYLNTWTTVTVDKGNVDLVRIGCVNPNPAGGTCGCVAYDDIDLCFIYYA